MRVLALDISSRTGWALMAPGETPEFGVWELKGSGAGKAVSLWHFVDNRLIKGGIDAVVFESPLSRNSITARLTFGLSMAAEMACHSAGVKCLECQIQAWRRHFIGVTNAPTSVRGKETRRRWLKARAIEECHSRGWMVESDDEADACGIGAFALGLQSHDDRVQGALQFGG